MPRPDASKKLAASEPKTGVSKVLVGSIIAALVLIALVAVVVMREMDKQEVAASRPPASSSATPQVAVNEDASGVVVYPGKAKEGAPQVDVYSDPQCPFCGQFEQKHGKGLDAKAKDGSIKLVYHPKSMLDSSIPGEHSERAVNAMLCAVKADKFIEFQELMFAQQPEEGKGYPDATLKLIGATAGIDGQAKTDFEKCVDTGEYRKFALKLEEYSKTQKIKSTPTILIAGKKFDLEALKTDESNFEKAVEAAGGGAPAPLATAAPTRSAPAATAGATGATSAPATSAPATKAPGTAAPTSAAPATTR